MKGVAFQVFAKGSDSPQVMKFPRFTLAPYWNIADHALALSERIRRIDIRIPDEQNQVRQEFTTVAARLKGSRYANVTQVIGWIDCKWGTPLRVQVSVQPFLDPSEYVPLESIQREVQGEVGKDWALERDWLEIAEAVAEALTEIHTRRVVHGDLWPPNVFVRAKEQVASREMPLVKLIDFGESWAIGNALDTAGTSNWRHAYSPPERVLSTGRRSESYDVYAFGVLLMWLACGHSEEHDESVRILNEYRRFKSPSKADPNAKKMRAALGNCLVVDASYDTDYLEFLTNGNEGKLTDTTRYISLVDAATKGGIARDIARTLARTMLSLESIAYRDIRSTQLHREGKEVGSAKTVAAYGTLWSRTHPALFGKSVAENRSFDPGLPKDLTSSSEMRSKLRKSILDRSGVSGVLRSHPYIIDLIVSCCDHDSVRRPRMVDVLREMKDRSNDEKGAPIVPLDKLREEALAQAEAIFTGFSKDTLAEVDKYGSLLTHMVSYRVNGLGDLTGMRAKRLEVPASLEQKLIDIYESRDVMIDHLCWLLQGLKRPDWIASVSTLNVWQGKGFGHDGRYITANLMALKRGVGIHRLFSLSIHELGSDWLSDLLTNTAYRIVLAQPGSAEAPFFKEFCDGKLPGWRQVAEAAGVAQDVVSSFEALFSAYGNARREEHKDRTTAAYGDPAFGSRSEHTITHSKRLEMRRRLQKIIGIYVDGVSVSLNREPDLRLRVVY